MSMVVLQVDGTMRDKHLIDEVHGSYIFRPKDDFLHSDLVAVTALYDIGRGEVGRPIEQYIGWLNNILRLSVRFTIFLDPAIDPARVQSKPSDRIIQVPLDAWHPMRWEDRVNEIRHASSSQDLTFTLPRYSLLVMSKYDMLKRVAEEKGGAHPILTGQSA